MSIGSVIRSCFGPFEATVAETYRRCFVDLDAVVAIARQDQVSHSIVEVGCGEGAVTERLAEAFPDSTIRGIDLTPRAGRLFRGDSRRVSFHQQSIESLLVDHSGTFDLAVVVDVIHHIPAEERAGFLASVRRALSPGGRLLVKEWLKSPTPVHCAVWASDRFVTGDRIEFMSRLNLESLVHEVFGQGSIRLEHRVGPWRNNLVMVVDNHPLSAKASKLP